ncbi:hypothetical protein SDC9_115593 [bioreactor metagenome]|uniref:Uncharacterized protein n=1 Tax=bioreactor metagenome TaxID=1076179 RepID=A0A645BTA6_9ZZZZ
MRTAFVRFINSDLNIFYVIECIKNTDDINTVFNAFSDEHSDNVIWIMLVSQ